jgi:hypothetical protein
VFFKLGVEVGVEDSIMNAPPDYDSDQLFKSNLTFWFIHNRLFNASFDPNLKKHTLYINGNLFLTRVQIGAKVQIFYASGNCSKFDTLWYSLPRQSVVKVLLFYIWDDNRKHCCLQDMY